MKFPTSKSGFTLTELVVSIAIISVIATILLGSRNQYSERLILKNETYNSILYIRQAQVYSLGVKASGSPATFNTSYGIYFEISYPNQFIFFTDENADGKFQSTEANEIILLKNGITIQKLCLYLPPGTEECYPPGGGLRKVAVTFRRPNSSAKVLGLNSANNVISALDPPALVYFISKSGLSSSVKVDSTGVIAVLGI